MLAIRQKRAVFTLFFIVFILAGITAYWMYVNTSLIEVYNVPETFSRRSGYFMAHVTGSLNRFVRDGYYSVNGLSWRKIGEYGNRIKRPQFTVEIASDELRAGRNELNLRATAFARPEHEVKLEFNYDPSPIHLPLTVDWSSGSLEVDDGCWERFTEKGGWRVRPKPGFEDYDRILIVTGSFKAERRIETDIVFHGSVKPGFPYGVGVLSLWGGRPDDPGVRPLKGWHYGITWFYSKFEGVGMQFSNHYAEREAEWLRSYRSFQLRRDVRYHVVIELQQIPFGNVSELRYIQRMKWWAEDESEPEEWIELKDVLGVMPDKEYGIALMAHRCRADFGPVTVLPLGSSGSLN